MRGGYATIFFVTLRKKIFASLVHFIITLRITLVASENSNSSSTDELLRDIKNVLVEIEALKK